MIWVLLAASSAFWVPGPAIQVFSLRVSISILPRQESELPSDGEPEEVEDRLPLALVLSCLGCE